MVSTVVQYSLSVFIGFLLLTSMSVVLSGYVDDQNERVTEQRLEHIGQEVSTVMIHHYEAANKDNSEETTMNNLNLSADNTYSSSSVLDNPTKVSNQRYTVQVGPNGDYLILTGSDVGTKVSVPLNENIDAEPLSGGVGGRLLVTHNGNDGSVRLETSEKQL